MEYIVFAGVIFAIIVLIMLKGFWDERKKKRAFIQWLREHYGELPKREEYKEEELKKISRYFRAHEDIGFHIDDITWNDLDMDEVFKRMNYTYSAAGEEYLYYLLRTPMQDADKAEILEKHVDYFIRNKEERIAYQTLFAQIGKTGKYSIYDYLDYLDLLGERNNGIHYLGILAMVVSLAVMFFSVQYGIILLVVAVSQNIISYFKYKNEIDPYIISFGYILKMIQNVEKMEKLPAGAFAEEMEELKSCRKKMGQFKAGSYIIMSPSRMNASGNPLELVMDYIRMIFHLDLIKFNLMLSEVRKNKESIDKMLTIIGYMEAAIAVGAFRASLETYCLPRFDRRRGMKAENMYHPLLEKPVKNSILTEKGVLLTGSNASGKSTFLKTVAVNAILAQTVHTCMADSYSAGLYRIMSSMALRDNLSGGDSYYIVEIKSLKRILNQIEEKGTTVLCFVDEVLRGTNTVERIAASTQILKSLSRANVLCFAATHDIELTHLLEKYYNNYHFEEEIIDNDVVFHYQLLKGRATTRNAIKLLGVMGYEKEIIREAEKMAEDFLRSGNWERG
ncbi:MAG TPA: hypothetical protein DCZ40_14585 [Lachnospiraceae bacterium]|nr:hypothetical protein [Lachnospiraceae bacterium]